MSRRFGRLRSGALALAIALAAVAPVKAVTVQPLVIDLQAQGSGSALVRVENTYTSPMPVELRVYEAEYSDSGVRATTRPSNDLLVFPPQALIGPGRTQSFRIQFVGQIATDHSRHFIVTVAQLPVQMPQGQSTVQILYNFNVVVGVSFPGQRAAISIAKAEISTEGDGHPHPVLFVQNAGTNYGYLANGGLQIVQRDATGREVFRRDMTNDQVNQEIGLGLVGPGQTRRIVVPITLPQPGGTIEAKFTPSR